jgi:hypothetical protein
MSRFNPYLDQTMLARPMPPAMFRLRAPRWAFGLIGVILMTALAAIGLMLAPLIHPALAVRLDPVWTGLAASALAAVMLSPVMDDGVTPAGVIVRGAVSFATIGLFAPIAAVSLVWLQGGLHSQTRLAALLADAGPDIAISAGLHGAVGLATAALAALIVCQLER